MEEWTDKVYKNPVIFTEFLLYYQFLTFTLELNDSQKINNEIWELLIVHFSKL